jgi:hypothetical protein
MGRKELYTMLGYNPGMVLPGGSTSNKRVHVGIMNHLQLLSNGNRKPNCTAKLMITI